MKRKSLILITAILILSATYVMAEPGNATKCCSPKPIGGMQSLIENTVYPGLAEDYKFEGDVVVNFHVDELGNVTQIQIAQSGGPIFDESATVAIVNTKWSPAMQNGEPVAVTYSQPFQYRIR